MKLLAAVLLIAASFWIGLNGLKLPERTQPQPPVKRGPVEPVPSPVPTELTPR
jgi:hypothetical protein